MKNDNPIVDKSYLFSIQIIMLFKQSKEKHSYFPPFKQLLRSGTSIGANIEEARETRYWLRLLRDTAYINEPDAQELLSRCEELLKMLTSALITSRRNLQFQ